MGSLIAVVIALKVASIATASAMLVFSTIGGIVTAATWAWGLAIGALQVTLGAARIALLLFNLALWANPVGAVVAAIVGLVAVAALLVASWGPVTDFFVVMWDGLKKTFSAAVDGVIMIMDPFLDVIESASSLWEQLAGVVSSPINAEINTRQSVVDAGGEPSRGGGALHL